MTRIFDWDKGTEVREAVGNALGAASMCWEHPEAAGEFLSDRAVQILEELMDLIDRGRASMTTPHDLCGSRAPDGCCTCDLPPHQQPTHLCHCGHRWTDTGRKPD